MKYHIIQPCSRLSDQEKVTITDYYLKAHCIPPVDRNEDQEAIEGATHHSEPSVERTYIGNDFTPTIVRREPRGKDMAPMTIPIISGGCRPRRKFHLYPVEHGPSPPRNRQLGFLDLPGELRNQIYELLTHSPKVFAEASGRFAPDHNAIGWHSGVRKNRLYEHGTALSLRMTCKQVHQEATSLVYGSTFVFRDYYELCGFVARLAQAPPEMRIKTFAKVVLHVGRDRYKLPHTIILNKDNDRLLDRHSGGGELNFESSGVIACGWWRGISMLLHNHNVENLELVSGSRCRQLLTKRNVKRPLIMNLLKTNFHVKSLKVRDFNPEINLSNYALPRRLIARWEGSERQAGELTRDGETTSADNIPVTEDTKVLRINIPATDDIKGLREKHDDTSSAGAEPGSGDSSWAVSDTEVDWTLSQTEEGLVQGDQTAAMSGGDLNLSEPVIHIPDDVNWKRKIWADWPMTEEERTADFLNEEEQFTSQVSGAASPGAYYSMGPYLPAYPHTESISGQATGQKRDFDEYKEDMDPADVATQDDPEWTQFWKHEFGEGHGQ